MTNVEKVSYAHKEVIFPKKEYTERLSKVRKQMKSSDLNGFLAFEPACHFYLTGFQSINSTDYRVLVITLDKDPSLIVWGDSELPAAYITTWLSGENIIGYSTGEDNIKVTHRVLENLGLKNKKIGLEEDSSLLTPEAYNRLTGTFDAQFVNSSNLVKGVMSLKSEGEIEYIRKAAGITEKGMSAAIDSIKEGVTDNEVAKEASQAMLAAGSEYMCMQPIVTSGMRSGIPHSTHRRVKLEKGDSVLLEMSGCYNRYNAPMMRSAFVGKPTKRAKEISVGCKIALDNVLNALGPGKTFDEVAKAGKKGISEIKEPIIFHKVYGYSIGIGFPPTWADNGELLILEGDDRKLKPGMVFHHTMSVRDPGKYGIALSETSLITESGCEVLTSFDRELFQIPALK